jgi:hypothetical protein
MKANTYSQQESRRMHPFNANHRRSECHNIPLNHFMKARIVLGLCVLLGAGFISARAADNPAQAAARAALEQKLNELDHPPISVPPVLVPVPARGAARGPILITPSGIVKKPRCIYAAIFTTIDKKAKG